MRVDAQFHKPDRTIEIKFDRNKTNLNVGFKNVTVVTQKEEATYYDGDYFVIPQVDQQVLPTAQKTMKQDLTVKAIPTYNVGNLSGGSTFYIATMEE